MEAQAFVQVSASHTVQVNRNLQVGEKHLLTDSSVSSALDKGSIAVSSLHRHYFLLKETVTLIPER